MAKSLKRNDLKLQQEVFCREYVIDYNGSAAAIRAKYTVSASRQQSHLLLTNPNIRARIAQLEAANALCARVTKAEIVAELSKIAFLDIKSQYQNVNESGTLLNPFDKLDGTLFSSINEKRGKDGEVFLDVRFHDKMKALELLAKHCGVFNEDQKPAERDLSVTLIDKNPDEL